MPAGGSRKKPIKHGTPGGYQTHWLRGQEPCEACSTAHLVYQQELRVRNTQGTINQRKRNRCAYRARMVLSQLHKAEYRKLYEYELQKVGLE